MIIHCNQKEKQKLKDCGAQPPQGDKSESPEFNSQQEDTKL
jgi:hypothetical protein